MNHLSSTPLALVLACAALSACAANVGGNADDDDGGGPVDACPCPDGAGGDGGGGGDGGDGGGNPDAGCNMTGNGVGQPFGNHAGSYASGAILPNHRSGPELDDAVRDAYDDWKARYLRQGCGSGRYYIDTGHDGSLTVSEGHGYGMLILAFMAGHDPDARTAFDGMFRYFEDHPSEITDGLMAWSQDDSCNNNNGASSAADGDLDIAYALLLADKQWSSGGTINYRAEAERVIDAIRAGDVDNGGNYVLLGDWVSGTHADSTRSSDFMPTHLASFAAATGDGTWTRVLDTSYGVIDDVQTSFAAQTGLLPDFIVRPLSNPAPAPANFLENPSDGQYSYNACRDPWRIALDFMINGDPRGRAIARRMNTWIRASTGDDPDRILPGYRLDGGSLGRDYRDNAFIAPFGVAAMVDASNQTWLNRVWDSTVAHQGGGYYGDSIGLLSLIAMSGNWWSPESAACP